MKKILLNILIIMLLLFISTTDVHAAGSITPSTQNLTIEKDKSATFNITANNAVGKVDIISSNPEIATINLATTWLDNNTITVTVTGIKTGTTSIFIKLSDAATYDEEELTGEYNITITVNEPVEKPITPTEPVSPTKSTNNNLSNISVSGYKLEKVEDTIFQISIPKSTNSLEIKTSLSSSKATVSGDGIVPIDITTEKVDIIVTAESGAKKTYTINIKRIENYTINDIENVEESIFEVILEEGDIITTEIIESIIKNKKTVTLNYYNNNDIILYSWILDSSKISTKNEIDTSINFNQKDEIDIASNYSNGIYINLNNIISNTDEFTLKIYVGDKYESDDTVNIYGYKNNELSSIKNEVKVEDSYIEMSLDNTTSYLITKATLELNNENINLNIIYIIVILILLLMNITIVLYYIFKIKKKNQFKKTPTIEVL